MLAFPRVRLLFRTLSTLQTTFSPRGSGYYMVVAVGHYLMQSARIPTSSDRLHQEDYLEYQDQYRDPTDGQSLG